MKSKKKTVLKSSAATSALELTAANLAVAAKQQLAGGPAAVRLLSKPEICAITGASFPTIWLWMRQGRFPLSRVVGGKSMWLSTEVEHWLNSLPLRRLKPLGDEAPASSTQEIRPLIPT